MNMGGTLFRFTCPVDSAAVLYRDYGRQSIWWCNCQSLTYSRPIKLQTWKLQFFYLGHE